MNNTGSEIIFTCHTRKIKRIAFYFLFTFFFFQSHSQTSISKINWQPENDVNFYTYPPLPHKVQGFAQDLYGYLWIGSSGGLYRFDGVSYKRYAHEVIDSNSIGANNCNVRLIDSQGMLWLGNSIGLCILNTRNYKCHNFNFSDSLFNDMVTGAVEDGRKNIWLTSFGKKNLTKYDPAKNKFTTYSVPDSLYGKGMRTFGLTLNPDGKIYVAADGGMLIFNPQTGIYEKKIPQVYPNHSGSLVYWSITQCIISDNEGTIYVGDWSAQSGNLSLGIYDRKNQCTVYSNIGINTNYSAILCISEKSDDELWIGTDNGGLIIYNKRTKQTKFCKHKADDPFSFPREFDSGTADIFKDRAGCTWFNSTNKIVKADIPDQLFKSYDLSKLFEVNDAGDFNVTSVLKLSAVNKLLVSSWSGEGFYEVDLKKNELKKNKIYTNLEHSWCELQEIKQDSKGRLWAYTQHLLLYFDSLAEKFIPCPVSLPFPGDPHKNFAFIGMLEDSRGHFWLGTSGHGIYDFNPQINSYIYYPKNIYNAAYSHPDFIKPCFEDDQQNIWFASFDGTYLFNLENKTFTRISYKDGDKNYNDGRDLLKSKYGNIWRTTAGGGFQKYNTTTKMFDLVTTNMDTRQVKLDNMIEDSRGYIWISNDEDVYRFDPLHSTFLIPKQSMNIEMGNSVAYFCEDERTLYTVRGAILYETNINLFNGNTNVPHIVFNSFKVLNNDTSFEKNLNDLKGITLPYNKNFITIEFAALNFSHSENNRFVYKMDGIDKIWAMNGNKNSVTYSNLAPGKYFFHVKASNNTGLWNDVGKSLSIIITPPWWQTWWFRLIAANAAAVAILYGIKIYTGRKLRMLKFEFEKQQRILEERTRIASELHDDLGSGLTKISLLSQVVGTIAGDRQQQTLKKITKESSELVDKMNGIIWALNTKNDTLPNLIIFIRQQAYEMFEDSPLKIVWNAPGQIAEFPLSGEVRRNIYLVVKEVLHNTLKYSAATQVEINILIEKNELVISIHDNGKGFNVEEMTGKGNGLLNMNKRMNEIGGSIKIESEINIGTAVKINFIPAHYTNV